MWEEKYGGKTHESVARAFFVEENIVAAGYTYAALLNPQNCM